MVEKESSQGKSTSLAILSGSNILVWDLPSSTRPSNVGSEQNQGSLRSLDPYPQYNGGVPIASLAWNHNQMVIATASAIASEDLDHDNIVLLSSQGGQKLDAFQHDSKWKQKQQNPKNFVNSINFGGKSRYLCIGDESGAVCLWDLKKKIRVRQFFHSSTSNDKSGGSTPSHPSLQVCLDPSDTYVLSLSPSVLYQYNLRDGQLVGTLEVPNDDAIDTRLFTEFSISSLEPNICAVGTTDGGIYIYDIEKCHTQELSSYQSTIIQRHSGAVTGLAFSPDNRNLLFSSGSDGVVFAHNKSNGTSHRICGACDGNNPIDCFGLYADGVTCAIGCRSGDVFVYDIRYNINGGDVSPPLLASYKCNGAVDSLVFAPPPRIKAPPKSKAGPQSETTSLSEQTGHVPSSSTTSIKSPPSSPKGDDVNSQSKQKGSVISRNRVTPFANLASRSPSKTGSAINSQKSEQNLLSTTSPTKAPSSPGFKTTSRIRAIQQSPTIKKNTVEGVREVVREELEELQDHMEEKLRNLHIDMINQFHQQSQEIEMVLSKHISMLERLTTENQQLREENERLRRGEQI